MVTTFSFTEKKPSCDASHISLITLTFYLKRQEMSRVLPEYNNLVMDYSFEKKKQNCCVKSPLKLKVNANYVRYCHRGTWKRMEITRLQKTKCCHITIAMAMCWICSDDVKGRQSVAFSKSFLLLKKKYNYSFT